MSATSSTKWFWSDWLGDEAVRRLTPAERGVWIDLLALASAGNPTGYVCDVKGRPLTLEEIARLTNGAPDEVAKLIDAVVEKGAASRDRTGRLFNRRMVRDAKLHADRARAGMKGAAHTNLINQQLRAHYKILPQQVTRQNSRGQPPPLPMKNLNLSSETTAARASNGTVVEKNQPDRSLATALPVGALASDPTPGDAASAAKPPSATSRAELDAIFAKKRASMQPTEPAEI